MARSTALFSKQNSIPPFRDQEDIEFAIAFLHLLKGSLSDIYIFLNKIKGHPEAAELIFNCLKRNYAKQLTHEVNALHHQRNKYSKLTKTYGYEPKHPSKDDMIKHLDVMKEMVNKMSDPWVIFYPKNADPSIQATALALQEIYGAIVKNESSEEATQFDEARTEYSNYMISECLMISECPIAEVIMIMQNAAFELNNAVLLNHVLRLLTKRDLTELPADVKEYIEQQISLIQRKLKTLEEGNTLVEPDTITAKQKYLEYAKIYQKQVQKWKSQVIQAIEDTKKDPFNLVPLVTKLCQIMDENQVGLVFAEYVLVIYLSGRYVSPKIEEWTASIRKHTGEAQTLALLITTTKRASSLRKTISLQRTESAYSSDLQTSSTTTSPQTILSETKEEKPHSVSFHEIVATKSREEVEHFLASQEHALNFLEKDSQGLTIFEIALARKNEIGQQIFVLLVENIPADIFPKINIFPYVENLFTQNEKLYFDLQWKLYDRFVELKPVGPQSSQKITFDNQNIIDRKIKLILHQEPNQKNVSGIILIQAAFFCGIGDYNLGYHLNNFQLKHTHSIINLEMQNFIAANRNKNLIPLIKKHRTDFYQKRLDSIWQKLNFILKDHAEITDVFKKLHPFSQVGFDKLFAFFNQKKIPLEVVAMLLQQYIIIFASKELFDKLLNKKISETEHNICKTILAKKVPKPLTVEPDLKIPAIPQRSDQLEKKEVTSITSPSSSSQSYLLIADKITETKTKPSITSKESDKTDVKPAILQEIPAQSNITFSPVSTQKNTEENKTEISRETKIIPQLQTTTISFKLPEVPAFLATVMHQEKLANFNESVNVFVKSAQTETNLDIALEEFTRFKEYLIPKQGCLTQRSTQASAKKYLENLCASYAIKLYVLKAKFHIEKNEIAFAIENLDVARRFDPADYSIGLQLIQLLKKFIINAPIDEHPHLYENMLNMADNLIHHNLKTNKLSKPELAHLNRVCGKAHRQLMHWDKAREAYQKALEFSPNCEIAKKHLKTLTEQEEKTVAHPILRTVTKEECELLGEDSVLCEGIEYLNAAKQSNNLEHQETLLQQARWAFIETNLALTQELSVLPPSSAQSQAFQQYRDSTLVALKAETILLLLKFQPNIDDNVDAKSWFKRCCFLQDAYRYLRLDDYSNPHIIGIRLEYIHAFLRYLTFCPDYIEKNNDIRTAIGEFNYLFSHRQQFDFTKLLTLKQWETASDDCLHLVRILGDKNFLNTCLQLFRPKYLESTKKSNLFSDERTKPISRQQELSSATRCVI